MNDKKQLIPIFFSIDDNYAPLLSVAVGSIIHNASKDYNYKIIVLYKELNEDNRRRLSELAVENFEIQFVDMEDRLDGIEDRIGNRLRADYFTLTIYFRLFIPAMFPEYDKTLYLDSDIVVPGDISELYKTDLGDNLIAACHDHSVVDVEPLARYIENAVGVNKYRYINSGVLLMNAKKLREANLDSRFLDLMNKYQFDCLAPDQDYLNVLCKDKIHYLDECWDAMPTEGKEPIKSPKLIHYNLFAKPWCYDNIQYEEYFWEYAKKSSYLPKIMEIKNNYSEEQKKSDSESLKLLMQRGIEIVASRKNTFRNVFNEGREARL